MDITKIKPIVNTVGYVNVVEPVEPSAKSAERFADICPECGSVLQHIEGCCICRACGYSKCG